MIDYTVSYKTREKGSFLLETVIALSLTVFIIHSFVFYTLKMKHVAQIAELEISFSNCLAVLSERMYQCKNKQIVLRDWQNEYHEILKHVNMTIKDNSESYKIEFHIGNTGEARVFIL